MAFSIDVTVPFDAAGLTLYATLITRAGVETAITTGFTELGTNADGWTYYHFGYDSVTDGFLGSLKIYDSVNTTNCVWLNVSPDAVAALADYDPPTSTEMTAAFTEIKGATWSASTDTLEHIRDKETDLETDTQDLQTQVGTDGAGLTALPWNASWDAEVQSECVDALTAYDAPTNTALGLRTKLAADYFDPSTDEVTPTAASKTGYALTSGERTSIADALLDRTNGVETGVTPRQAWQRIGAVVAGECSGAGTGTEIFIGMDGITERVRGTTSGAGNRTAVEYDHA